MTPRSSWGALLLALCAPAFAASSNDCLSDAQRSELFSRQVEASAIAAMEVGPRVRGLREARANVDKTREAWATCEAGKPSNAGADTCAAERAAFQAATDALPGVESSHASVMQELRAKTAERVKSIRDEYPRCGDAAR